MTRERSTPIYSRKAGSVCPKCQRRFSGHSIGHHAKKCGVTLTQLFWSKVNKEAPGGCWIWTGSIKPRNGYGHLRIAGQDYNAHRWAYQETNGPIAAGMEVMHSCDVPACVNVAHMRLGTHVENMLDCYSKRRHAHGERQRCAKLTEPQVLEILSLKGTATALEVSKPYGVHQSAVGAIWRGATWKHLQEVE